MLLRVIRTRSCAIRLHCPNNSVQFRSQPSALRELVTALNFPSFVARSASSCTPPLSNFNTRPSKRGSAPRIIRARPPKISRIAPSRPQQRPCESCSRTFRAAWTTTSLRECMTSCDATQASLPTPHGRDNRNFWSLGYPWVRILHDRRLPERRGCQILSLGYASCIHEGKEKYRLLGAQRPERINIDAQTVQICSAGRLYLLRDSLRLERASGRGTRCPAEEMDKPPTASRSRPTRQFTRVRLAIYEKQRPQPLAGTGLRHPCVRLIQYLRRACRRHAPRADITAPLPALLKISYLALCYDPTEKALVPSLL